MSFLPVVERELRAAARKPSTYRTRMLFVVLTSLVAAMLLLLGERTGRQVGDTIFPVLATLAFLYCLAAGIRQAADCLSEEKREGTLGLLFLTDLRGYDVVMGKLVAVSTRTFQGLIAFLPVLSIGLLLGGITAGEFWRAAGVLTNTLFFALSVGLCVSAVSQRAHVALAGTMGILLLLTVAPLLGDSLLSRFFPAHQGLFAWASPGAAGLLVTDGIYQNQPHRFWSALLLNHALGWAFLLTASIVLPRSWQDRPFFVRNQVRSSEPGPALLPSEPVRNVEQRRRLLDANPICWLASRHERARWLLWTFIAIVAIGGAVGLLLNRFLGAYALGIPVVLHFGLAITLKLWVAWRACATLAEARRSGAVELLLATPIKVEEIINGHWQALQRFFLWPAVATSALYLLPLIQAFLEQAPSVNNLFLFPAPAAALFGIATFLLDLVALAWVGMWMGVSQGKSVHAFAKTVLFAMVIPAIVLCLPNVLFDLFWISWARRKLDHEFRRAAIERFTPHPATQIPLQPAAPLALPPVISR